jgi:hypothetical protein
MAQVGAAQTTPDTKAPAPDSENQANSIGPTAFVQFAGKNSNLGAVTTWDFDLGYNFTSKFAVDIGVPLYTTRTPFSLITTAAPGHNKDWRYTTILGAPTIDLRYTTRRYGMNITSMLTGSIGFNEVKIYSTGRMAADLFNHVDREYDVWGLVTFTPFLNFGEGTGSVDRSIMASPYDIARPYETLGFLANGEAGGNFIVHKHYKLGGSAYGLAPQGGQKVFSRLVSPDSLLGGDGHHNRFWDEFFETGGEYFNTYGSAPSRISRDNGYSAWFEVTRYKNLSIEVAYTRSVHYAYDSAFIMINYNLSKLLRNVTTGQ